MCSNTCDKSVSILTRQGADDDEIVYASGERKTLVTRGVYGDGGGWAWGLGGGRGERGQ